MSRVFSAWWPTSLFAVVAAGALLLTPSEGEPWIVIALNVLVYSAFSVVGAWIVLRSRNRMGRLFQALALTSVSLFFTEAYLATSLPAGQVSLPKGGLDLVMVWTNNVLFVPFFCLNFVFPFLLFPTGRASSPRWSYLVRGIFVWLAVVTVALFIAPVVELQNGVGGEVPNPWAVDSLAGEAGFLVDHVFEVISLLGLVAILSLIFRYRSAGVEQRAQIRWFLLAGIVLMMSLLLDEVLLDALPMNAPTVEQAIELTALVVGLLGLPVATAIAILKYRLYDVDVVINKTLVYGSMTAMLAGLYGIVVVAMQRLLPGGFQDSEMGVAGATLAVAASVRPLRGRLQSFIDRRFYRRKYDVAATIATFSNRVRNEVDLDDLSKELVETARTTMQPAHASLWIRTEGGSS